MATHNITLYPYDILFRRYYGNVENGKPTLSVSEIANRIIALYEKAGTEANTRRSDKQKREDASSDVSGAAVDYHELAVRSSANIQAMAMTLSPNDMNDIIRLFEKANDDFGRHWRKVAPDTTKEFEDFQKGIIDEIEAGTYGEQASEEDLEKLKKSIEEQRKKYQKWYNKPEPYVATAVVLGLFIALPQIKKIFGA